MTKKITVKKVLLAQIAVLLLVIILGLILRAEPYEGPRSLHKIFGMLSGVLTLTSAVMLMNRKTLSINQKAFIWVPFTLVVVAAVSGNLLGEVDAYEMVFNMMLMSGFLAFITSIAVVLMLKKQSKAKPSSK